MGGFWGNLGFMAVCFVIVFGYKKYTDRMKMERMSRHADARVYDAAEAFARGADAEVVRAILDNCPAIGREAADAILAEATRHRGDGDGGYRAFLRAVNAALGDLCDERHHPNL